MACSGSSPTWTATPDYASVSTCVGAAVDNDTVNILGGTATWNSRLSTTKAITIQGSGIGVTIIRNGVNPDGRMISMTAVVGKDSRLSGMTINDDGAAQALFGVVELLGAPGGRIRVDHVKFDHPNGFNIMTYSLRGVFDHNEFVWSSSTNIPIYVFEPGADDYGDESWNNPVTWGSSDFLFVEDNTFTFEGSSGFASDGYRGTRAVYRFNTLTGCSFQNHGTESSGRKRGGRAMEVYGNNVSGTTDTFMALRSGSGLSWGNTGPVGVNAVNTVNDRSVWGWFQWNGPADGRMRWDVNDGANPYTSGTASGGGALAMTVAGTPWTPDQYKGYQVRKTSTCNYPDQCTSPILSNTSNQLTLYGNGGFGNDISFSNGETYEINKVTEALDQCGRGGGSLFQPFFWASGTASAGVATINFNFNHGLNPTDEISLLSFGSNKTYDGVWIVASTPTPTSLTYSCSACSATNNDGGDVFKVPAAFNDQVDFPIYQWLNTSNGANTNVYVNPNASGIMRENEHYYNYDPTPTTSGTNQTVAVRSGTFANRPGSCTSGVGYWATDQGSWRTAVPTTGYTGQGRFYRCVAGAWDAGIEPYGYPHSQVSPFIPPPPVGPPQTAIITLMGEGLT